MNTVKQQVVNFQAQISFKYISSARTSQEIRYVSATKINLLMLFKETIANYYENHLKYTNALRGENEMSLMLKQAVHLQGRVTK
jgi:hypothetical protein